VTFDGEYFRVDSARIWDLPDQPVPIAVAVSGEKSVNAFAPLADHLVQVQPDADVITQWNDVHEGPSRVIGQVPICWGPDKEAAVEQAHEQFRWFGGGWAVNADLPTPAGFAAASQFVRPDDVADAIACGPDLDELAESARPFLDAGFTDIAFVQVGDEHQDRFLAEAAGPLLEKVRALG
jgi:G6PDH family F420-dependent oxidoreductase